MTVQSKPIDLATLIEQGKVDTGPKFLDQDGKSALAAAGTPFTITDLMYTDGGEYGPSWQFTVELDGKTHQFNLGSNDNRDKLHTQLATMVVDQPISGCRLYASKMKNGNEFITVGPVE